MREGRAKKYLMWLFLLWVALVIPVVMLLCFGSKITDGFQRWYASYFRMLVSSSVLVETIIVSWSIPSLYQKMPRWLVVTLVYGLVGVCVAVLLAIYIDNRSITFGSSLAIFAIINTLFFLNVVLIFFVQMWVVYEKWQVSFWAFWTVHMLFVAWMYLVFFHIDNAALIVISAFIVLATVPIAMLVEICLEKRALAMVERIGKIYS